MMLAAMREGMLPVIASKPRAAFRPTATALSTTAGTRDVCAVHALATTTRSAVESASTREVGELLRMEGAQTDMGASLRTGIVADEKLAGADTSGVLGVCTQLSSERAARYS